MTHSPIARMAVVRSLSGVNRATTAYLQQDTGYNKATVRSCLLDLRRHLYVQAWQTQGHQGGAERLYSLTIAGIRLATAPATAATLQ